MRRIMEASLRISASCLATISSFVLINFFILDTSFRVVSYLRGNQMSGAPRHLHDIDATRVHLTMKWVVSFSILSEFGPRRGWVPRVPVKG